MAVPPWALLWKNWKQAKQLWSLFLLKMGTIEDVFDICSITDELSVSDYSEQTDLFAVNVMYRAPWVLWFNKVRYCSRIK